MYVSTKWRDFPLQFTFPHSTLHLGMKSSIVGVHTISAIIVITFRVQVSFGIAHDIATSADGQTVYVAEVKPNRIWKFVHETSEHAVHPLQNTWWLCMCVLCCVCIYVCTYIRVCIHTSYA